MKLAKFYNVLVNIEILLLLVIVILNIGVLPLGYKPYVVKSGSMEPKIHTGSMVYVNTGIESSKIKKGDIIAFNIDEGKFVTHRVIDVDSVKECFTTKGDANEHEDFAPVPFEKVVGRTDFSIPYFGYFMSFLSTLRGKIILVGLFISQFLFKFLLDSKEENEDEEIK